MILQPTFLLSTASRQLLLLLLRNRNLNSGSVTAEARHQAHAPITRRGYAMIQRRMSSQY
eukprot:CAMPEP_0196723902 /NCGR_PEP_ID=MMETSP1091-20130531/5954_1 /TAXON_ID=302021 /ORGANISM="Rhodomonas sp., Strain CCMP768" /LENGTH=59 /DNA_ID=CAMNT_0042065947 /DNA_START=115 /DNA_END=291 /DNA_ORIENTATION=+